MKRPTGWPSNPQALALVSQRMRYQGDRHLGRDVDVDTWLTPRYILAELGTFDLDPCAAEENRDWTGTKRVFTKVDDGLQQPWNGRVFMNPPFSNAVPWIEKHATHGSGITLVAASIESKVWRSHVWPRAAGIYMLHGRTRFCNPDGSSTLGRPLRSIALIGWSAEDARILGSCSLAGVLLTQWEAR